MSSKSGSIWIDLTDLLAWSGNYTGIQRVTYEYAKRFEKDGALFFAYDSSGDRFIKLNLEEALSSAGTTPTNSVVKETVSVKRKIRQTLGKPYYGLSAGKRAFLQPYVYAFNHTVRSVLHVASRNSHETVRSISDDKYANHSEAVFSKEDTVVLLGAGWNEMNVLKKLTDLKLKYDFRLVQHINDILPIYQPHLFADELPKFFLPYVKMVVEFADAITVISEATKRDVEAFCKQQGVSVVPAIHVIRLGDNPQNETSPSKPEGILAEEDFILAVGTFEIRKNYQLIYQAVKLAELEGRELPKIVIAGRKGWLTEDIRHVIERDPFVASRIVWLNNVNDGELRWLYANCMFTIFPSLAEGWGLPIAESLGYGKMCLASGVSSMLEIGDGLVDYFLPYDTRGCMEKIMHYTSTDAYQQKNSLVSKEYKMYSWDESYSGLAKAIAP